MRVRSPCGIGFANGVVDAVSPVIGAAWPALNKSTELALKLSSSESSKVLSDGSLPVALHVAVLHGCICISLRCL
ncbi:hypothetical protein HanRHA438_Chr11g0515701 [Helianthus annuus]|uniref:Uncharacterized protein n=1 Tax=Helianthus annuus TaxID=4232 RepID=A0A251TCQ2_HELAN|nr:hypothetical protein HanXRQr2_Chr11g0503231 [Helianthus annuus]KAJ0510503.1 hypothetical protein HanIR_Chr11g0541541 [Helianthus annuus]KAJ0871723.1 hypothetical protein HanRHA438_Chr11g0515701 [Helianthus annuus]KAJ0876132.1 hypothetical protein HanPSC8_Chr11g0484931 [Helianthus annuus]